MQVLLRLRPVVEALPPGAIVEVVTDDPAAPVDLAAWCHLTGHDYLGPAGPDSGAGYRVRVCGTARQVDHRQPWTPRP